MEAVSGLGRTQPLLAWPLTIGMLALAGLPGTSGFMGKLFLIEATVDGDYTWLGVIIVVGSMVSLAYYLRVIAAVWMRPEPTAVPAQPMPAIAGGSPEADTPTDCPPGPGWWLVVAAAVLCGAATIVFGVAPSPLVDWASHAASSLTTTIG
jgi:NADH-quinone oxidoreductase subunit N